MVGHWKMTTWLEENLICPRHGTGLHFDGIDWKCSKSCVFPTVDSVPIMLLEEVRQTMGLAETSLRQCRTPNTDGGLYVESLGITDEEKRGILNMAARGVGKVDPVVSFLVGATNGNAFKEQIGMLNDYPIPELRLAPSNGKVLLDIGCNWGRWCVAASRKGYTVVGIDPSLGAVMAAKRVARELGVKVVLIVGDARFLPIKPLAVDCVFSYSVLQHLDREDTALVASEIHRVLDRQGTAHVQMPSKFGIRCLYHQMRRSFREAVDFDVRYWSIPSLRKLFSAKIGPTTFSVDCFFGIGLQFSDLRFMTIHAKLITITSELLRFLSRFVTPLVWAADSVFVSSTKSDSVKQDAAANGQSTTQLVRD